MQQDVRTTRLWLAGMRHQGCRERVVEALEAVPGVLDAEVSLIRGSAKVHHMEPCRPSDLLAAVLCAGYAADVDGLGTG